MYWLWPCIYLPKGIVGASGSNDIGEMSAFFICKELGFSPEDL